MEYGENMPLRGIFEDKECAEAFDRVLPGIRAALENRPEIMGLSVKMLASFMDGSIPREKREELDEALKEIGRKNGGISPAERARVETYLSIRAKDEAREKKPASRHQDAIYPGEPWLDVSGARIQAHAGGFLYEDGVYYWYGENKEHTDGVSEIWTWGIRLYSSTDFYNWEDRGLIIPPVLEDPNSELFPEKRVDRPHIVKNPNTGRYVCWYKNSGADACFNVLTADTLLGSWEMEAEHLNPFGMRVGDFDLVIDEDTGTGYIYCEADHKKVVGLRLNRAYTGVEALVSTQYENLDPPFTREGVTVFRHGGKLWMLTSGMTGYVPNQSDSAVSEGYELPFVAVGDPHVGDETLSSFNSQISQCFRVPGKQNLWIAVADRWVPGFLLDRERAMALRRATASRYDPEHYQPSKADMALLAASPMLSSANTSRADYVVLPIVFEDGRPKIAWKDKWRLEDYQ